MAQSMIERHLATLEKQQQQVEEAPARLRVVEEEEESSVLHYSAVSPDDCSSRYMTDSPMGEGEDITDTAVSSPMSASSISSRRRSSTSHRRKSTPKKRQWEPTVYSDGESAHEESYSDDPQDDLADSFSSGDDFRYRRQVSLDDESENRLVIDERDSDSPASFVSRDSKDAKDTTYFSRGTVVKDAIMAMRIKSESFDDYYQAAMGRYHDVGAGQLDQKPLNMTPSNPAQNNNNKANRKAEHKCPFCHFVYTSVNYLLSHLYRVHFTVDPAELQRAIAGITAPFKNGESKSTQYSRAPHMDEHGRVVAPPVNELPPLPQLNGKTSLDLVDGDLPPAKIARISPASSRTSSPVPDIHPKKRSTLACPKCHMRFSSRSQFETHIRNNTCTAVEYPFSVLDSAEKFDCHLCGRRFGTKYELDDHAKEHRAPTPVRCDTCDLYFSDPESLQQHRKMHDAQIKCMFCGLTFNSMETLKRHTETHFNGQNMAPKYNEQSSPASTDSDKENSPDQAKQSNDDKTSNSSRKLLLAELQDSPSDSAPQNLTVPKVEPQSPTESTKLPDAPAQPPKFMHQCTLCHVKCVDVTALVEHITKCHSNDPIASKNQPYVSYLSQGLKTPPMPTNPLMGLGGFYPSMYMQNPLFMGHHNFDPKMYTMQPNILMNQLTKNIAASMAKEGKVPIFPPSGVKKEEKLSPDSNSMMMNLLSKEKKEEKEKTPKLSPMFPNTYMPPYLSAGSPVSAPSAPLAPKSAEDEEEKVKQRTALIQQQNESEKPFSCGQCNKRFKRNCHLQLHKRTHTDDLRSYRCPQCGMRFIQLRSLEQHLKTHSIEKPYNCDYCGKKFAQKYNLKLHIRTHTGEKPYKCSYCEMRFADPGSLNRHTRTHTGEKPYSCDYCGKKFAQKYNLHLHIRVHTHDRPFRCVYCDKRFAQKSNLLMHLKLHVEYLQQLQNGTLPNMAELLDNGEKKGDGPVLPSEAELRIIESERKKIEDELVALEKAELADKILSEEGARREKEMIFNKDELAAMGKSGLALMGIDPENPIANDLSVAN